MIPLAVGNFGRTTIVWFRSQARGRFTPCVTRPGHHPPNGAHGVTRPTKLRNLFGALLSLALGLAAQTAPALTLEQLCNDPQLTPEGLMQQVADFKFRLGRSVQKPEEFLANQAGDCDDFATLAAEVLRHRGYTPRLVVVHMQKDTHVVCYVDEIKGYLDYNRRGKPAPVVASEGRLAAIAAKVAASFRSTWRSASEFTYLKGQPRYLLTAFR
jgi:hypothetical protein